MQLKTPYLLFLGDAPDALAAKVAKGIRDWRPQFAVGQLRMDGCQADLGLTDMTVAEAAAAGAGTLVVGVANRGGIISDSWVSVLDSALESGMELAAGLHNRLADVPALAQKAAQKGLALHDVRHPTQTFSVANGKKRSGKRLLPVGTDCSCGKMYTALALEKALLERQRKATFRATGQTGILISGAGVSVDAVIADFIAGAVEWLTPDNDDDHWDIIEGQGSLYHASFAGVTAGLIHGAQPDALVLCHEPTRTHMRGLPDYPVPDMEDVMKLSLQMARLTNPKARFAGISVNTANLDDDAADEFLFETGKRFGLPVVDPVRTGVDAIVDQLDA
ncbi:N-acetyltransferase DgcN [Granulosicoccaceae sp. 1_MG-2023]|nr:N-acetyltransferase DgcN [Granulosicoccaceae sp. 1_MG-2023]